MERNRTESKDYTDLAQDMLDCLATGTLPHVGTLRYMHGASAAGRAQAEVVMDRMAADPQLAEQFDAALAADEARKQ
jgi:hypothetical protein